MLHFNDRSCPSLAILVVAKMFAGLKVKESEESCCAGNGINAESKLIDIAEIEA